MKALFLRNHFQPQYALLLGDLHPPPHPTSTQVHIRVQAASVSTTDPPLTSVPLQPPTPPIPGRELAGVVIAVGAHVTHVAVGNKVAAVVSHGAWAEEVVVEAACVVGLEDGVGVEEGCCLVGAVLRAVEAVRVAGVKRGERVLIGGAAGCDGVALAWVVRELMDGEVVAVVEGRDAVDVATKSGIATVVDRSVTKVGDALDERKVRVAFDCIGEGKRIGEVVQKGGIVVRVGEAAREKKKSGVAKGIDEKYVGNAAYGADKLVAAAALIEKHVIRVPYGPRYGVGEYVKALARAEEGLKAGKVVMLF